MEKRTQIRFGVGLMAAAFVLMAAWVALHYFVRLYVDAAWFDALGYPSVFWRMFRVQFTVGGVSLALVFAALLSNALAAFRVAPKDSAGPFAALEFDPQTVGKTTFRLTVAACALIAVLAAFSVGKNWLQFLNYLNAAPFGIEDPVFGNDIGYYVFKLPVVAYIVKLMLVVTLLCAGMAWLIYFVRGAFNFSESERLLVGGTRTHLSLLLAIAAVLLSARFWIARYHLLYSRRSFFSGAGYTDLHAQVQAYYILMALAVLLALWLVINTKLQRRPGNMIAIVSFGAAWLALSFGYPWVVETFVVRPNQWDREKEYIAHNIEYTRQAYGLADVTTFDLSGEGELSPEILAEHEGTTENLLLWDPNPLLDVYNQKQRIRSYYAFGDVDIDRYEIDGELRPVMTGVRELAPGLLPETTQLWTNLHLQYTHGYGLCMSFGNRVTEGGLPAFLVNNIPPETYVGPEITQPRIYFGERTETYALVQTKLDEFDYPGDPDNYFNRYDGEAGIPVGGRFRRMMLSLETGHKDILFTKQFTEDSRILLHRKVRDRAQKLAPFLFFDENPYPVVTEDGRIVWIVDGYTLTRRYPYSETIGIANYWRNSVKATVDAYDGTTTLYVMDRNDPILKVFRKVFPDLFKELDDMPRELRDHIRYPADMFSVQTAIYRRYHMTDPKEFFNGEDLWEFPIGADQPLEAQQAAQQRGPQMQAPSTQPQRTPEPPRYVVMELPNVEGGAQFCLFRTFTVEGKDNMIAWMAAGCDGDNYGKLFLYAFPKGLNIYGPNQMKGRFNQDPEVSSFVTLIGQRGSAVIPSKVLTLPVGPGLLYLQSLFVEDPTVKIPELKQVVVGHQDAVAMAPAVDEALEQLFLDALTAERAQQPPPSEDGPAPEAGPLPIEGESRAWELYQKAQTRLDEGDLAGFSEAFDALGAYLEELREDEGAAPAGAPQD